MRQGSFPDPRRAHISIDPMVPLQPIDDLDATFSALDARFNAKLTTPLMRVKTFAEKTAESPLLVDGVAEDDGSSPASRMARLRQRIAAKATAPAEGSSC